MKIAWVWEDQLHCWRFAVYHMPYLWPCIVHHLHHIILRSLQVFHPYISKGIQTINTPKSPLYTPPKSKRFLEAPHKPLVKTHQSQNAEPPAATRPWSPRSSRWRWSSPCRAEAGHSASGLGEEAMWRWKDINSQTHPRKTQKNTLKKKHLNLEPSKTMIMKTPKSNLEPATYLPSYQRDLRLSSIQSMCSWLPWWHWNWWGLASATQISSPPRARFLKKYQEETHPTKKSSL